MVEIENEPQEPVHNVHITKFEDIFFLQMRKVFENRAVKDYMISMIVKNLRLSLDVFETAIQAKDLKDVQPISSGNIFFEWTLPYFRKRIKFKPQVIHVLCFQNQRDLEYWKTQTDLKNLKYLLDSIAHKNVALAFVTLLGCQKLLGMQNTLVQQNKFLTAFKTRLSLEVEFMLPNLARVKYNRAKAILSQTINKCMDEQLVYNPIVFRYMQNSQFINLDSFECKTNRDENNIINEIKDFKDFVLKSNFVHKNKMNFMDNQIEAFRRNINFWSWKYDTDFDKIDNEVATSAIVLKALERNLHDHKERLQFYRSELKDFFDKLREAEELELEKNEAEKAEMNEPKELKTPGRKGATVKGKGVAKR